jgi:23S rRNA pseudouridine1911/1915/1917 synthase
MRCPPVVGAEAVGPGVVVPELTVEPAEAGLRLDAFLARRGLFESAAASRRFLAEAPAPVRGDGRPARKGERLREGQLVQLPERPPAAAPGGMIDPDPTVELTVLYEDEALVAVSKPAGMPSHPLRPGERGTVASALVARFPECAGASPDPREAGLVHRLDVGTSGVLVAARQRGLWTPLHETMAGGGCEKVYLAEVAGAATPMVVDAAIGRVGRRGDRVRVGSGRGLLPARTEIEVAQARGATTLVRARLARGRPHQVRAHLAHCGWPVLGDPIYADPPARELAQSLAVEGLRLHASTLRFLHPTTAQWLTLESPPPPWARTDPRG